MANYNVSKYQYFKKAIKGESNISEVVVFVSNWWKRYFVIATPVFNKNTKIIGVYTVLTTMIN